MIASNSLSVEDEGHARAARLQKAARTKNPTPKQTNKTSMVRLEYLGRYSEFDNI